MDTMELRMQQERNRADLYKRLYQGKRKQLREAYENETVLRDAIIRAQVVGSYRMHAAQIYDAGQKEAVQRKEERQEKKAFRRDCKVLSAASVAGAISITAAIMGGSLPAWVTDGLYAMIFASGILCGALISRLSKQWEGAA